MPELSTLGGVIKPAYESQTNTNAFTDAEKAKLAGLAPVAASGAYADLTGRPTIPTGAYGDLTGKPSLDFVPLAQRGAANGVAPLDAAGLVPMVHLNVSGLSFKGAWNPTTNTPTLIDGAGSVGDFYKASTSGTFNFGNGSYTFNPGDWAIFAAGVWQRIGSSELVASVNGKIGDVVLTAADVGALPSTYTAPVTSVNGADGAVTLNAASVGARPSASPVPWSDISGKPVLPTFPTGAVIGPAVPAFLIRRASTGSFQAGAPRHIAWDSVVYDPFGGHAGSGRYTVPAWAGFARVTVAIKLLQSVDTGTYVYAYAYVNEVEVDQHGSPALNGTRQSERLVTSIFPVVPGDSISSRLWHSYSANRGLEFGPTGSFMQIELFEAMT